MPPTLRGLLTDRTLGLRPLAGTGGGGGGRLDGPDRLDRPITWVHVSELTDPTPFLSGGELLLTTGLALGRDGDTRTAVPTDESARDDGPVPTDEGARGEGPAATELLEFVDRLRDRGITGLGFGVGLSHAWVPAGLVQAAERVGMPLLQVPRRTPFIAISKAVSAALAAEAYAEVTTTNAAQDALAKAALGPAGPAGVVRRLARLLGGWVLLLDGNGAVVHAGSAVVHAGSAVVHAGSAVAEQPAVVPPSALVAALNRLRERSGPGSATFILGGDHVTAQALGSRPRAFLAAGRPDRLGRADQTILNSAAMLLTLALTRTREQETAQRRLRTGLMRLMLAGRVRTARDSVRDLWGALPAPPVRVLCLTGPRRARGELADLLEAEPSGELFFAELAGELLALAAEAAGRRSARGPVGETPVERVGRLAQAVGGLRLGVSDPMDLGALADGHRQARQAAEAALRAGTPVMRFEQIPGHGLLGLMRPAAATAFAESLLAPLIRNDRDGRGDLVRSLGAWLAEHGQWDPAAARLGVHRHTLRNRMRKVEELTGTSLDSPGTRAEFWFALRLHATPPDETPARNTPSPRRNPPA